MPDQVDSVQSALEELRGYANDVQAATYSTFDNTLRRYVARLQGEPLQELVAQCLPEVEFDSWYQGALEMRQPMGSSSLDWPTSMNDRVAHQLELVRRMADGEAPASDHVLTFHRHAGRGFDLHIADFVGQTFLPMHRDLSRVLFTRIRDLDPVSVSQSSLPGGFVDAARMKELRAIESSEYDLGKLIMLCEELDRCYRNNCFYAVAALTRSLLDHVPPIFGCTSFSEVSNNHSGSRSFSESMAHLAVSARKIADGHLHTQIRRRETLPTRTQVDFSRDVDVLLAEVVRILT